MSNAAAAMPYDTFATPPLDFSPLIGDETEQKLKATLVPLLRKHGDVKRAYLARAHYDGKTGGLVLGLVTPGEDSETLVAEIGKLFASMFDSSQHLDVIFLSDEQLAESTRSPPPSICARARRCAWPCSALPARNSWPCSPQISLLSVAST